MAASAPRAPWPWPGAWTRSAPSPARWKMPCMCWKPWRSQPGCLDSPSHAPICARMWQWRACASGTWSLPSRAAMPSAARIAPPSPSCASWAPNSSPSSCASCPSANWPPSSRPRAPPPLPSSPNPTATTWWSARPATPGPICSAPHALSLPWTTSRRIAPARCSSTIWTAYSQPPTCTCTWLPAGALTWR